MEKSIDYVHHLNPDQQYAVGSSDQPLYAFKKTLQWAFPDKFSYYMAFMGLLHAEQLGLVCIGQLIKGFGIQPIFLGAQLDITGL